MPRVNNTGLVLYFAFHYFGPLTTLLAVYHFLPHRFNDNEDFKPSEESDLYAFWAGSVMGLFVHILAIAHVLLWGLPSSVVGSIVS